MANMIEIKLPNGLIIAMLPNNGTRPLLSTKSPVQETEDQLWQRFIHALTTTDWKALATVYSTAMPQPPKIVATVRAAPVAVPVTKEQPAK